jgi:hypothetical protein
MLGQKKSNGVRNLLTIYSPGSKCTGFVIIANSFRKNDFCIFSLTGTFV